MSFSLKYKRIFLSFLQNYFENSPQAEFKWDKDVRKTNIIIADKHSVDKGSAFVKPAIILNRGMISWTKTFRGEGSPASINNTVQGWKTQNVTYQDLVRGTITFHVVCKTEYLADLLANEIFTLLTAYKRELKSVGIHEITSVTLSQEQLIKSGSTIELAGVTVSITFAAHEQISRRTSYYKIFVEKLSPEHTEWQPLIENLHYVVKPEADGIKLLTNFKSGTQLRASYTEALTLEEKINQNLTMNPEFNTLYLVPSGDYIWGYYKIVQSIEITDLQSGDTTQI